MSLTLNLYLNTVSWLLNSWFHGFTVWRKVVSIQGLIVHFNRTEFHGPLVCPTPLPDLTPYFQFFLALGLRCTGHRVLGNRRQSHTGLDPIQHKLERHKTEKKDWEGFQFRWLNIKGINSAFHTPITLCSNHLKWNKPWDLSWGSKKGSGPVQWSASCPSFWNYWYIELWVRIEPIRRQW